MVDKIEMSLDDIIKQTKKDKGSNMGRKGGRGAPGKKGGPLRGVKRMNKPVRSSGPSRGFLHGVTKLRVSGNKDN